MNKLDDIARSKADALKIVARRIADTDAEYRKLIGELADTSPVVGLRARRRSFIAPRTIVMAAAAAVLVVVVSFVVAQRDHDGPSISPGPVSPDSSDQPGQPGQPSVTNGPTTSTTPSTSTTSDQTSVDPAIPVQPASGIEPSQWLSEQFDAGLTFATVRANNSTDALLIIVYNDKARSEASGVLLDEHRLIPAPDGAGVTTTRVAGMAALGDRIALFQRADRHLSVWILDPVSLEWSIGPELGLGDIDDQSSPEIHNVDGSVLVSEVISSGQNSPVSQTGVVLSPDLGVRMIAQPPAAATMTWTVVSGTHALLLGHDAATDNDPLRHPWSYDIATDTWTAVPTPDWVDCGPADDQCEWREPHEAGDMGLVASTPLGVVARTPDGSIGLFDADAGTWRRLDDAPITLATPETVVLDDGALAVFPQSAYGAPGELGTVGVLDIASGSWKTQHLAVAPVTDQAIRTWDIRFDDSVVLAAIVDSSAVPAEPELALDRATGARRQITPSDKTLWAQLYARNTDTQALLSAYPPTAG